VDFNLHVKPSQIILNFHNIVDSLSHSTYVMLERAVSIYSTDTPMCQALAWKIQSQVTSYCPG